MARDTYDVADPGPRTPDPADDPPPATICPHCGGGPPIPVPRLGAIICKSCARVVTRMTGRPT